jgi:hypothetical protein
LTTKSVIFSVTSCREVMFNLRSGNVINRKGGGRNNCWMPQERIRYQFEWHSQMHRIQVPEWRSADSGAPEHTRLGEGHVATCDKWQGSSSKASGTLRRSWRSTFIRQGWQFHILFTHLLTLFLLQSSCSSSFGVRED